MEEVLGHVPKEQRLLYAVGVLLQSQTFPLSGVDLEKRLEELLVAGRHPAPAGETLVRYGVRSKDELCVDLTDYPNVAQIEVTQLQHLVDEAADFVARQTAAFLQRLLIQYSGIPDLATSFKRASRDSHGLLHLVDLGPTPKKDVGACWVKTLSAIPGVTKEEVLQRLQMTAGQVRGLRPLPLSAALLRLANLPEQLIFDLRHRILSRHHSMSHIFETMAPHLRGLHGQGNLAKLILDDFRGSFQQVLDDDGGEDEDEAKLTTLFAACDTHQDGGIDQEELQQALSIAAPPANLSRLRTLAILQFGSWRAAFHSLGIGVEDPITEARFVALASNLDIAYEDAWAMFATLSPTGEPVTVPELSQHGSDFGLHEFALRVWLAGEAGSTLQDAAKRLHAPAFEGDLGLQRFREVCGLSEDGAASLSTASASLGTASKGLSSSKRIPSVKCHPPLTENEVTAAYAEFKAKYHSVTLGAIRSELESNTAFSNVLALDRSSASIGETMVVRYRVPHALQSQLREHPFIALVPSNMAWMSGGGGCWMIGRTTPVTEMTGPKFSLNRNGEGVLRLQVWPGVSHLELGAADLRIFASPDGMAIGRQVGSSAMFQLRPPAPAKIMIEAASLTPTSTRLLWEAPNPPVSRPATESQFRYVVRGKAMGLDIEQEAVLQEQQVWSHLKKSTSKFLSHQVHGLLPGVRYQFQVHAFSKSKRGSFVDNSPRAGGSAAMAAATTAAPEGLESLASPGVEVTMPERPAPPRPSHAILVERGLGGSFTLRWAEHESGGGGQNAWGYEVFWTVPQDDEEPETAQKHVDHEDAFAPGEKSLVWRYPGPVFFRKPGDGTVEGLLHPPEADAVPLDEVSFCVRAVDPFSSGVTSPMGDLGPAVPLPSAAEAILREAEAMKLIGEGAVRAGGFKRFLEEAEDAGLIGTGSSSELDLRRVLYKKVEEAGGLKEVIEAMTDLQMKSFKDRTLTEKAVAEADCAGECVFE
ncbi:Hypothetical protein (Fragment) [Durusdinium trenchii]|uniref:Calmodulin n=1 Tax=Durusdinium trenchii TaxID=1381693 RepID=A0ABP0NG88_9DINO